MIERPSALLKEVLENSVDAKAKNIAIEIHENGLKLILIEDDGVGIAPDDLPLAFCRHATSKLRKFEDIYSLDSYGFRGEALASISSISKITCDTKTLNGTGLLKIDGGETRLHEVEKTPVKKTGTKLFIKDLFYNTPARMKFIQSATSEKNKLKKIINAFLITNPKISFSIKWDQGEKCFYDSVSEENFEERIKQTLFAGKKVHFFHNENSYDGLHVNIYLTKESSKGNAHKQNFLFINDRIVQDTQIHKIILNSAAPLWTEGESGSYIVMIKIPSDEIDVNIHPNKTLVKFFKPAKVFSLTSSTIKQIHQTESLKIESSQQESFSEIKNEVKDFNYREFDFSSESKTTGYFENLHSQTNESQTPTLEILAKFKSFYLIKKDDEIFILSLRALFTFDLRHIFSNCKTSEIIPLLVSRPVTIKENFNDKNLEVLTALGFECDLMGTDSLILRSFPKVIQHYPYLKFISHFLHSKAQKIDQLENDITWIESDSVGQLYIAELIMKMSKVDLISNKIILPLNESHLCSIYDKK